MIQGLYSGAAALDVLAQQQEATSANLANLNSAGHRSSKFAVVQRNNNSASGSFPDLGPSVGGRQIDFSQGRHHQTGRALDVAISGDGFFAIEGSQETLYTRNGRFYKNPETGTLVNDDGLNVLGTDGPITIDDNVSEQQIAISSEGIISANGEELGTLKLVAFNDNSRLDPRNSSIFAATNQSKIVNSEVSVNQFHQEYSNAHPVTELISLIVGSRQYEAVQKVTRTISESLKENIRS